MMGNGKKRGGEYARIAAAVARGVVAGLEPHLRKLSKLDKLDKLDAIEERLGSMDAKLDSMSTSIDAIRRVTIEGHLSHEQRIKRLEKLAGLS